MVTQRVLKETRNSLGKHKVNSAGRIVHSLSKSVEKGEKIKNTTNNCNTPTLPLLEESTSLAYSVAPCYLVPWVPEVSVPWPTAA